MTEQQPEAVELDQVVEVVSYAHPDGWVYLTHPDLAGTTRIPDDPDVLDAQLARGWVVVDPPEVAEPAAPVVHDGPPPPPTDLWVAMTHPQTGGTQRLPNDAAAIAGARDAGWITTEEAAAVEAEALATEVDGLTVAEVLTVVDGDLTKAAAVLAAERDGKNRSSLIAALEAITAAAQSDTDAPITEQES